MQYMLMLYGNEAGWSKLSPDEMKAAMSAYIGFNKELTASGKLVHGEQLKPSRSAKTVRAVSGKVTSHDGPFTESKEQLGGYYVIEVANEAEAVAWASKCPAVFSGGVELRELIPRQS